MARLRAGLIGLVLVSLLAGCGPTPTGSQTQRQTGVGGGASESTGQGKTLIVAHRYEPSTLAPKVLGSNGPLTTTRLFNASLSIYDTGGVARPYLAEALPQLNTDTWTVSPDGRMETTYKLRSGLTWHDGTALTADDFVFAMKVYKHPELGVFIRAPQNHIDAVLAPDPRTLVIQWRTAYPDAGVLSYGDLDALPSHTMEAAFNELLQGQSSKEAFLGGSIWTTDYVGAGPYRLERWEPGLQLEGSAFDGHPQGRVKIDRVLVKILIDENAVLASVMAGGQLHYTHSFTLRFEHMTVLKRDWEPSGKGIAAGVPGTAVWLNLQQRPDFVGDEALLDLRVRRALAHALDRPSLNDGLFDGIGFPTDEIVPKTASFYPDYDRAMTRYALDDTRANQLMGEAGFTKDSEGLYANAQGRRFKLDFAVQGSPEIERMQAILSDSWKRRGFEVNAVVMAVQVFTELRTRHTIPGLGYSLGPSEASFAASEIGTAANGFAGLNRTGWTHPEYERLKAAADSSLEATERGRYTGQMMALVNDNLPGYPLYYSIAVRSRVAGLKGPDDEHQNAGFGLVSKATTAYWNIQDWTLQ